MTVDPESARAVLQDQRSRLVHQLKELGSEEDGELRADVQFGDGFADAGAATAERTEVLGIVESLKEQLDSVDAALRKVDDGSYGICSNCGKPISEARLEGKPESIFCIDCQSKRSQLKR
jgi:DnaK suppressor protein